MAILLLRYSEIGLKGISVRNRWENRLRDNILQMLAADGVEALVTRGQARFYVEAGDLDAALHLIISLLEALFELLGFDDEAQLDLVGRQLFKSGGHWKSSVSIT